MTPTTGGPMAADLDELEARARRECCTRCGWDSISPAALEAIALARRAQPGGGEERAKLDNVEWLLRAAKGEAETERLRAADAVAERDRCLDFIRWLSRPPVLGSEDKELDAAAISDHARIELESILAKRAAPLAAIRSPE